MKHSLLPRTCAFKLAGPHALPRGGALGTVGRLAAGLGAVAGEEDLPLVDATVVLRRAAHQAADAGPLWAVGAPLALQGRLGREATFGGFAPMYCLDSLFTFIFNTFVVLHFVVMFCTKKCPINKVRCRVMRYDCELLDWVAPPILPTI